MKNTITTPAVLGLILILALFSNCSSSKIGRTMKHDINGIWTLQTINTEGINAKFKATIFNEADFNCFIGSRWTFIANNSMGSYHISPSTNCNATDRNIRWSIYEPKDEERKFQFKRLDEKKKPLDNNDGFRLTVRSASKENMILISNTTFEGRPATIVYNFIKN